MLLPACIPYLFFSSTHATYCFGYPDVKFPKLHSSPSVRSLGDGGEGELSKTGTVDAWEVFGRIFGGQVAAPLSCNLSTRFVRCGPSGIGGVRDGAPETRVFSGLNRMVARRIRTSRRRILGRQSRPVTGISGGPHSLRVIRLHIVVTFSLFGRATAERKKRWTGNHRHH